jgi:hypothetical protein
MTYALIAMGGFALGVLWSAALSRSSVRLFDLVFRVVVGAPWGVHRRPQTLGREALLVHPLYGRIVPASAYRAMEDELWPSKGPTER